MNIMFTISWRAGFPFPTHCTASCFLALHCFSPAYSCPKTSGPLQNSYETVLSHELLFLSHLLSWYFGGMLLFTSNESFLRVCLEPKQSSKGFATLPHIDEMGFLLNLLLHLKRNQCLKKLFKKHNAQSFLMTSKIPEATEEAGVESVFRKDPG